MTQSTEVRNQGASQEAILRQWMELVDEFIESLARNVEFEHRLPTDRWHKLRLMKALAESMSPTTAHMEIPARYRCGSCGIDFDEPKHYSFGGSHYGGQGYGCPKCRSTDFSEVNP